MGNHTTKLMNTLRARIGEQKAVVDDHAASLNNPMTDVERTDLEFANMKEKLRLQQYEMQYMEAMRVVAQSELDAEDDGVFNYDAIQRAVHADRKAEQE